MNTKPEHLWGALPRGDTQRDELLTPADHLAPWEASPTYVFQVGDIVARRDDPETTGSVVDRARDHDDQPWPLAVCVRRQDRTGNTILEWWRAQSTELVE